jgi:hypothetical protein
MHKINKKPALASSAGFYSPVWPITIQLSNTFKLTLYAFFHEEWNLPSPLKSNFTLSCTLKGIRRQLGDAVVRKKTITFLLLLRKILVSLDMSVSLNATVWAVCLTMF